MSLYSAKLMSQLLGIQFFYLQITYFSHDWPA